MARLTRQNATLLFGALVMVLGGLTLAAVAILGGGSRLVWHQAAYGAIAFGGAASLLGIVLWRGVAGPRFVSAISSLMVLGIGLNGLARYEHGEIAAILMLAAALVFITDGIVAIMALRQRNWRRPS